MNSFMYLLSDKFFAAKLRISKTERHKANSPHEYFVWITALSCKYETNLFLRWVEKQHPENFQFKAHELHPYRFSKVNNKKQL